MNSIWFTGLRPLVLAATPEQAEGPKPADTIPASTNIPQTVIPAIQRSEANPIADRRIEET